MDTTNGVRDIRELLSRFTETARRFTRYCEAKDCTDPGTLRPRHTLNGKQFCSEHLEHLPYVVGVLARIDQRERDERAIARRGTAAIYPGCTIVGDVLALLLTEPRTIERLAQLLVLNEKVIRHVGVWLRRRKLVTRTETKRGAVVLRLVDAALKDESLVADALDGVA